MDEIKKLSPFIPGLENAIMQSEKTNRNLRNFLTLGSVKRVECFNCKKKM